MAELLTIASGRAARGPGDELRELEVARARAESRGDVARVAAVDRQLDELFGAIRESIDAEKSENAARARFSSGVRRPVPPPKPSPAAQMNRLLLERSGRLQ